MPFRDIVQSLGDAISGTDRQAAYRKGMAEAADIESTQAQTEASLALARDRRLDAERKERQRAAEDAIREREADLNDPTKAPMADIVIGGFGDEYSGAQLGRNRAQEYNTRETIATPSQALGDDVYSPEQMHELKRFAGAESLAPGSMISARSPRTTGRPVPVYDEKGDIIWASPTNAPGQRAAPTPGTGSDRDTTQERNIQGLVGRGVPEELAIRIVYGETSDPRRTYASLYGALRRNFASDEEAANEARSLVEELYGVGSIEQAAAPLIDNGGDAPTDIPEGSTLIGHTRTGAEVYETPDGQRLVVE